MIKRLSVLSIALGLGLGLVLGGVFVKADTFLRILRFTETKTAPAISANAFTVNLSLGTQFQVTLNANVTAITFTNPPPSGLASSWTIVLTQDGTGGRTVTGWPAAVKWAGGTAPTITSTLNKSDVITCFTYDGGTTDWCIPVGQNF